MTTSCLNSSQRLPINHYADNKQSQLFSLYTKKKVNPKLRLMMKSVKNNFGVVTCIGSDSFYVFTRQMLLHLDFNKAIKMSEQTSNDFDGYRSQQYYLQNNLDQNDIINNKKPRRQSIQIDELDTSFARANSQQIKNLLHAEVNQIESEYQFSHNQLYDKQLQQQHHFKKSNSSFLAETPMTHNANKQQRSSNKNYIEKNQQTLSQAQKNYSTNTNKYSPTEKNKSPTNFVQDSFHKDLRQFKQSVQQKKLHQSMKQKGMRRIIKNGQQKYVDRNDFLRFYSQKQIGTDKQKRPIQWFYCQLKDTNIQSIKSSYFLSSTIVYDLRFSTQPTREQFQKQLKQYLQFYKKLQSEINQYDDSSIDMPQVVVICPVDDSQRIEQNKAMFRTLFSQMVGFYLTENKKSVAFSQQSPFNQFHKNQSPSKTRLPPTPKRMPMTHKVPQNITNNNNSTITLNNNKRRIRLQFRITSQQLQQSGVLRENYSRMRQITSQGRVIFNQQSIKTICGNWVTSQCYMNLLEKLSSRLPFVDVETFYQQWQEVFEEFVKSTMQQAASKYEQKVNELIVGKTMISQTRLMQAHEVAKRQTLRQFSQKKIGTSRVYVQTNNNSNNLNSSQLKSSIRLPSIANLSQSQRKISTSRRLVESRRELDYVGDGDNNKYRNNPTNLNNQSIQVQQQQLLNLVQSRLQQQKQQLSIKVKQQSLKWCKKFLSQQFSQIKKRLQTNEIKSLSTFKQQLQFLFEIYKKKLETYSVVEYQMMEYYGQFMVENVFVGLQVMMAKEREEWRQKVKRQGMKFQQCEVVMKQMRKSFVLKERAIAEQKMQLENRENEIEQSLRNISEQMSHKDNEISYLKGQHQEKLLQQQTVLNKKINELTGIIQQLNKAMQTKTNDFLYLQSQLQKQQLLHTQTHNNYQQILATYKMNIVNLQKRVSEMKQDNKLLNQQKIVNENKILQLNSAIQDLKIQVQQKALIISELEQQITRAQQQYTQKQLTYQQQLQLSKQQQKNVSTLNKNLINQQKLVQQKLSQLESRLIRYNKLQQQLQKYQHQNQLLLQNIQTISNTKALLQQKVTLNRQQFQLTKSKLIDVFKQQSLNLQEQIKQIKQQNQNYYEMIYLNKQQASTQTVFTIRQKQQLVIKTKCRHCKNNQQKLIQALKIVDVLNQQYHKINDNYRNNQCVHCMANNKTQSKNVYNK